MADDNGAPYDFGQEVMNAFARFSELTQAERVELKKVNQRSFDWFDIGRMLRDDPLAALGARLTKTEKSFTGVFDTPTTALGTTYPKKKLKISTYSDPVAKQSAIEAGLNDDNSSNAVILNPLAIMMQDNILEHEYLHRALNSLGLTEIGYAGSDPKKKDAGPYIDQETAVRLIMAIRGSRSDRDNLDKSLGKERTNVLLDLFSKELGNLQYKAMQMNKEAGYGD